MSPDAAPVTAHDEFDSIELRISTDIVKRGLIAAPVLIGLCALIWGAEGAISSAFAVGIVLVNFLASAALMSYTARISYEVMMGAILFGFLVRLGLIMVAVLLVHDASWISLPALGATIIVTQLGLLTWEIRHVGISLAHSGLITDRPKPTFPSTETTD